MVSRTFRNMPPTANMYLTPTYLQKTTVLNNFNNFNWKQCDNSQTHKPQVYHPPQKWVLHPCSMKWGLRQGN